MGAQAKRKLNKLLAMRSVRITRGVTYQEPKAPWEKEHTPYTDFYSNKTTKVHPHPFGRGRDLNGMPTTSRELLLNAARSREARKLQKATDLAEGKHSWRNPKKQAKRLRRALAREA